MPGKKGTARLGPGALVSARSPLPPEVALVMGLLIASDIQPSSLARLRSNGLNFFFSLKKLCFEFFFPLKNCVLNQLLKGLA